MPHPVDSRLRGNDGKGIMRIYRIGTMRCIVGGLYVDVYRLGGLFWMTGMGGIRV